MPFMHVTFVPSAYTEAPMNTETPQSTQSNCESPFPCRVNPSIQTLAPFFSTLTSESKVLSRGTLSLMCNATRRTELLATDMKLSFTSSKHVYFASFRPSSRTSVVDVAGSPTVAREIGSDMGPQRPCRHPYVASNHTCFIARGQRRTNHMHVQCDSNALGGMGHGDAP